MGLPAIAESNFTLIPQPCNDSYSSCITRTEPDSEPESGRARGIPMEQTFRSRRASAQLSTPLSFNARQITQLGLASRVYPGATHTF
jgi:hypothetical protein